MWLVQGLLRLADKPAVCAIAIQQYMYSLFVQLPIAAAACVSPLHVLLPSCLQEDTATPLIAFGVTAVAFIVAAAFAVAYAGTGSIWSGLLLHMLLQLWFVLLLFHMALLMLMA